MSSGAEDNKGSSNDSFKDNYNPSIVTDKKSVDFVNNNERNIEYKFYPDNPESSFSKYRFTSKDSSQYYDPCEESSKMSFRCLEFNDFDREKCKEYFDAYRECKKQWLRARRNQDNGSWN